MSSLMDAVFTVLKWGGYAAQAYNTYETAVDAAEKVKKVIDEGDPSVTQIVGCVASVGSTVAKTGALISRVTEDRIIANNDLEKQSAVYQKEKDKAFEKWQANNPGFESVDIEGIGKLSLPVDPIVKYLDQAPGSAYSNAAEKLYKAMPNLLKADTAYKNSLMADAACQATVAVCDAIDNASAEKPIESGVNLLSAGYKVYTARETNKALSESNQIPFPSDRVTEDLSTIGSAVFSILQK